MSKKQIAVVISAVIFLLVLSNWQTANMTRERTVREIETALSYCQPAIYVSGSTKAEDVVKAIEQLRQPNGSCVFLHQDGAFGRFSWNVVHAGTPNYDIEWHFQQIGWYKKAKPSK